MVPGVEDVLHLRNLACEHSFGLPVPSSWFEQEPAPAEPHKMNTLVEEIFYISSTQTCVCWSSSASDCNGNKHILLVNETDSDSEVTFNRQTGIELIFKAF